MDRRMRGNRTGRPLAIEARRAAGGYLAVSAGASTAILALAVLHLARARPYRFRAVAALTLLFGVSYTAISEKLNVQVSMASASPTSMPR
jgi:hypothetical protein